MEGSAYYLQLLEEGYKQSCDDGDSKYAYLCDYIFRITTYDSELSGLIGEWALEIATAITNHTTFDYIKYPDRYLRYILIVNTPFFMEKLSWGTSIRGAWWGHEIDCFCVDYEGLYYNGEQLTDDLHLDYAEFEKFIVAMEEFSTGDIEDE